MGTTLSVAAASEPILATGVPGTTDMTFKQIRQMITGNMGEGVVSTGGFKVTQRGAGANLSVDVAAGFAYVEGDTLTGPGGQQKYAVPLTATANLPSITAPVGATRRDQIVLRVYDQGDIGDASTKAEVQYIKNASESTTPEALPSNCLLLAYVDVTVGAASITNAMILDRRSWAAPRIPVVTAFLTANQSLTTATITAINLTADVDPQSLVGSNKITVPFAGYWEVSGQVRFAASASATARYAAVRKNGATILTEAQNVPAAAVEITAPVAPRIVALAAGDYLELIGYQNSGGALNALGGTTLSYINARYAGPTG